MTTRQRFLIGSLGPLVTLLLNFIAIDLELVFKDLTVITFLGYTIRAVTLVILGGIWASLHKHEDIPLKLFELGIVAPAMLTALMNAKNIDVSKPKPVEQKRSSFNFFVTPSYAQSVSIPEAAKLFFPPKETLTEQFWRGLIGERSERRWFVIVGSHLDFEKAKKQAEEINKQGQFHAEVYAPYGRDPNYQVVIGANLTREEAQKLGTKAIAVGLSKDTYLWQLPIEFELSPYIVQVQKKLQEAGFSPGPPDGLWGTRTRLALQRYQASHGIPVTGELDSSTREALGIK